MNLLEYLAIAAALLPVLYIWCKPLGVCAILLAFMVPGYINPEFPIQGRTYYVTARYQF